MKVTIIILFAVISHFLNKCVSDFFCFWYTGSFNALLRELVAEFTLTDNSANTTTSLLRSLCHYDDSVLMGSWLQETDHKSIEDQVRKSLNDEYSVLVRGCGLETCFCCNFYYNVFTDW